MTNNHAANDRRMALQPSNSARFNVPATVITGSRRPAKTHGNATWRQQKHTSDVSPALHPAVQHRPNVTSITGIDSFCRDFTFRSTLDDMSRLRLHTPIVPYFVPMKTSVFATSHIVSTERYRPPMSITILPPPLGPTRSSNVIPRRTDTDQLLVQPLQAPCSLQISRKVKGLPLRKVIRGPRLDDGIRFMRGIPIIPQIPLPALPDIPDALKAREALRHRSSHMRVNERSYDMAALVGDGQAEVYCREYAYEMVPHLDTHMTTQIKSFIVRNTTWAQLSVRYGLSSKLLCPIHLRSQLLFRLKIQADLFEAHIGAFWLSFPIEERDSKASPILRAYFRQLLDHLFPIFHRVYASSTSHVPLLQPPRPTVIPYRPVLVGNNRSNIVHGPSGTALRPTCIGDVEKTDEDASDSDDAWFEIIGSDVFVPNVL